MSSCSKAYRSAGSEGSLSGAGSFLTSTSNPGWAAPILVAALCGYVVIGGLIFYQVVFRGGRRVGEKPEVAAQETATATATASAA